MKKLTLFCFTAIVLLSACSSTKKNGGSATAKNTSAVAVSGGDGSSFENAIVINATSESKGVDAEYAWLKEHYAGYTNKGQKLSFNQKKPYDIINIELKDGTKKAVYFDISSFFGKY